jgi:MFS transporter, DHA2 family, multidrug resistance protein
MSDSPTLMITHPPGNLNCALVLVRRYTRESHIPRYRPILWSNSSSSSHSGLIAVYRVRVTLLRAGDADDQAIARFYELVHQQGGALSYMDIFWVLGVLCSIMFVLAFFLKKNDPGAGGDVAVG